MGPIPFEMYHRGVSGMSDINTRKGTGRVAPMVARIFQSMYEPKI